MNEKERYEEIDRQFSDVPLPDGEQSWKKMKQLLDKDDDDRILPPILLRSCLGWGALLLAGLIVAWLLVRPEKWLNQNNQTNQTSQVKKKTGEGNHSTTTRTSKPGPVIQQEPGNKNTTPNASSATTLQTNEKKNDIVQGKSITKQSSESRSISIRSGKIKNHSVDQQKIEVTKKENTTAIPTTPEKSTEKILIESKKPVFEKSTSIDSNKQTEVKQELQQDSTNAPQEKLLEKKINPPKKQFFIAAGIGEQQQIPIAGQTAVPYSHYGRKGSLADYIPSIYVRLQKEKKWFIQAEFRYGAAQSVKEFSYNRQTKFDTVSNSIQTTTSRLKKTYYHQLPLSFNYFIKPNLSVGIGGMYSRFYGAITEQEIKSQNIQTQTTTVFKQIVPIKHFTDSFLYKTQVHVLLQADYQWKKFSFGLRYTKDIQPFIKYTNPDGTIDEQKNQSLQFIIRYQLWKSKKF